MIKHQPLSLMACAILLAKPTHTQLSHEIPPPPCLYDCILAYGDCSLCKSSGTSEVSSCIDATCDPRGGISYAEVYYDAICSEGGYLNYDAFPSPHFVVIPPNN